MCRLWHGYFCGELEACRVPTRNSPHCRGGLRNPVLISFNSKIFAGCKIQVGLKWSSFFIYCIVGFVHFWFEKSTSWYLVLKHRTRWEHGFRSFCNQFFAVFLSGSSQILKQSVILVQRLFFIALRTPKFCSQIKYCFFRHFPVHNTSNCVCSRLHIFT